MSARSERQPRFNLGRVVTAILFMALIVCAVVLGVVAYHADRADRADDPPVSTELGAAFADASRNWISHVDSPVRRVVLTSAEEYGSGNVIYVFDVYTWTGIGEGFATSLNAERTLFGGGWIRDGGFAGLWEHTSPGVLEETRAAWSRAYGPGRELIPHD